MKKTDVQLVAVQLPIVVVEQLKQIAQTEDRSLSSVIRLAIDRYLDINKQNS